jgi:hypothetical protein
MQGYEVTLKCDLTEYHPSLIEGSKGIIVSYFGKLDMYALIKFPDITLDIGWDGLEITDPEYIKEMQEKERKLFETVPKMKNIVYKRGPRGKYYGVEYQYTENGRENFENCFSKERGLKLLKYLDENNISYKTKII